MVKVRSKESEVLGSEEDKERKVMFFTDVKQERNSVVCLRQGETLWLGLERPH